MPANKNNNSFSLKLFFKSSATRFLLKIFGFYLLWQLLYDFYLHPGSNLDLAIVKNSITTSTWILSKLGYVTFTGAERLIGIDRTSGLWVGDACNGLSLFALFLAFIAAMPGKLLHKLWYIPSGILIIHFLNVFRIVFLAIIQFNYSRATLEFNHTYTFTLLIYLIVFAMWLIWATYFAGLKSSTK